jgi:hypothetical protein
LVRGGRVKDIGLRYTIVRGKLDTAGIEKRRRGRSLYGARRSLRQLNNFNLYATPNQKKASSAAGRSLRLDQSFQAHQLRNGTR